MNERIKELANEARQYAEEKQDNPFRIYTLDCFNEKFAELIIRECSDVVKYYHSRNEPITSRQILQHFGVEE